MANQPVTDTSVPQTGPLEEVTVTGRRQVDDVHFNIDTFRTQDFIRSCRYAIRIPTLPQGVLVNAAVSNYSRLLKELTFLSESVEFPGKTLNTIDYRMAGMAKIKPVLSKDYGEVSMTFYCSRDSNVYRFFSEWIDAISPNGATNSYFDEIVCPTITLLQFSDLPNMRRAKPQLEAPPLNKTFILHLENAYPTSLSAMPSSWGDDGFQRTTVTFFYERSRFEELKFSEEYYDNTFEYQYLLDAGIQL